MDYCASDDRITSASTISAIYGNLLQSPAPICMFYFAHPFGISSAKSIIKSSKDRMPQSKTSSALSNAFHNAQKGRWNCVTASTDRTESSIYCFDRHVSTYTPWPMDTWRREYILPPIVQALQRRNGQHIHEFEYILKTIRSGCHSPNIYGPYLHQKRCAFLNTSEYCSQFNYRKVRCKYNHQRDNMVYGRNGTKKGEVPIYSSIHSQSGLLRRRYSLPEIIIRRHHLQAQKQQEELTHNEARNTAPPPPVRENIPKSFMPDSSRSSNTSGGSDSNLSRLMPSHISMRQQLLRRIWSKEYRRYDRTSSLSPPMRRSSRRMQFDTPPSPEVCKECERLELEYRKSSPELAHTNSPTHRIQQRLSLPERPERIESSQTISSAFNSHIASARPVRSNISTGTSVSSIGAAPSDSLDDVVTATINSNAGSGEPPTLEKDNVYYVEIDDDQIHITTASTTATGNSNGSGRSVYYSSTHIESINSRSNDENDNTRSVQMLSESEVKELSTVGRPVVATASTATFATASATTDADGGDSNNNPSDTKSDNTIDKYISTLLIDNLNNVIVEDKVNDLQQYETHSIQHDSTKVIRATKANSLQGQIQRSTEVVSPQYTANDQIVYFPRYAPADSPENMSECSGKYSNDTDGFELPQDYIITMNPGSNYVENGNQKMVVRRFVDMPRTESLEVQPSSASAPDENVRIESDDDVSLVDSLDDPVFGSKKDNNSGNELSPRVPFEKSEAFFVSMAESEDQPVDQHESPRLNTSIASSMPDKLREKLEKRQDDMQRKRKEEEEERRYQWSYTTEPKQERRRKTGATAIHINNQFKPSKMMAATSVSTTVSTSSEFEPTTMALKSKERFLRSEIGLLESYTIDAQGNLQFKLQPTAPVAVRSVRKSISDGNSNRNVVHHTVMKRISSNKPQLKKKEMPKRLPSKATSKDNQSNSQKSSSQTRASKKSTPVVKDVQQMTLYHQSHSDIVTPDADCGPRRMYQKTEIRDGDKRIEILEIVECLNSSPESTEVSSSANSSSFTPTLPLKYSKLSRIPVPVASLSASSRSRTKDTSPHKTARSLSSRDSMHSTGASQFIKNLQQMGNNSRVDQIIADLLIEALNHSSEFDIEFVKTPIDSHSGSDTVSKRNKISRRNVNNSSGKRSVCSGKYQRVFDAIPEEKSGLSVDSSNEDRAADLVVNGISSKISTAQSMDKLSSAISTTITTHSSQSNLSTITNSPNESKATPVHVPEPNTQPLSSERFGNDIETFVENSSNVEVILDTSTFLVPSTTADMSTASHISTGKPSISTVSTITNGTGQSSTVSTSFAKPAIVPSLSTASTLESDTQTSEISSVINTAPSKTEENQSSPRVNLPRGRAAIESDHIETDAWFDCFGRRHTDSPIVDNNPPPDKGSSMPTTGFSSYLDTARTAVSSVTCQSPSDTSYSVTSEASTIEVISTKIMKPVATDSNPTEIPVTSHSSEPTVSQITSIAPTPVPRTVSSDSQKVLSLLDQTFETLNNANLSRSPSKSVASETTISSYTQNSENGAINGSSNGRSAKENQDAVTATSMNSHAITENNSSISAKYPKLKQISESVWQVGDLETTCDRFGKICLSPVHSTRSPMTNTSKTDISNIKSDMESSSFVVIDEKSTPGKLKPLKLSPTNSNNQSNRSECNDCFYCNREIHAAGCSDRSCRFCTSKTRGTTTATHLKPSKNKIDTNRNQHPDRCIETRSKSDHSHTQTKSKDSDLVSLKCRKVNKKVSRYISAPETDAVNGNTISPVHKSNATRQSSENLNGDSKNMAQKKQTDATTVHQDGKNGNSTIPKLPPSSSDWSTSTNSYDSSANASPVLSSPKTRSSKNGIPRLPTAERWQNVSNNNNNSNGILQVERTNSRYQDFHDSKALKEKNAKAIETESIAAASDGSGPLKNPGWTVTLAGTYGEDMAPDVEMRLSFPKKSPPSSSFKVYKFPSHHKSSYYNETSQRDNGIYDDYTNGGHPALLPSTNTYNPKRSLSRSIMDDNQLNFANNNSGGQKRKEKDCNLPDLKHQSGTNRVVAKHTAKKTIKRSEYSVAVASATRTISNFGNGKRAMSFQALNANSYRVHNDPHHRRDHSVDLGHFSSRRCSPSSSCHLHHLYDFDSPSNDVELSILGSAIAPERKPPVPTMSERDVTRRHQSCFTRNKPLFS